MDCEGLRCRVEDSRLVLSGVEGIGFGLESCGFNPAGSFAKKMHAARVKSQVHRSAKAVGEVLSEADSRGRSVDYQAEILAC